MSDASMPLPAGAPAHITAAPMDPLAGDWSEGLPGPLRALAVPEPRRLTLDVAAPAEAVAAPAAWEGATADPLHSTPAAADPSAEPAQDAPTPWSDPVAQAGEAHDAWLESPPAAEQKADEAWTAPAETVQDWQPEAPASESAPQAAAVPEASPPDWSTLDAGPDWSAAPEAGAVAQDGWDAPPPPAAAWTATPAEPEPASGVHAADMAAAPWTAPAASAPEGEWTSETPPTPAPAWNAPSVGASALEQLDSEPPEPEPGAAQELFGTVPEGGSLSGDGEEQATSEVFVAAAQTGPEVLAEAEEVLKPVDPNDDADLPMALDETAPAPKLLAALRPTTVGALEVAGEHRVAVHTRGGRTMRGTVRDVDLSKPQFALQPQGGGSTETVYHSDVKVIFFMLAPGEKVQPGSGERVRVKLSDGRVIEGGRDGAEARHGFFLVPGDAARTNTRRIYVAREAAAEIEG